MPLSEERVEELGFREISLDKAAEMELDSEIEMGEGFIKERGFLQEGSSGSIWEIGRAHV